MSQINGAPPALSPDDALPPVEPPSAGFIIQLFIVPGIIVLIIVMVWVMFNWLAQKGNDPEAYVQALERNNAARWQAAVNLAQALSEGGTQQQAIKNDARVAKKLAGVLEQEIARQSSEEENVKLRMFLARALGAFRVPDVLPALLKAASREEKDSQVRFFALQAIAVWADALSAAQLADAVKDPGFESVMLAAARDEDRLVRSTTAYVLGIIQAKGQLSEPLAAELRRMLEDTSPDVRYNAATALARSGQAEAIPVLAEMLDPAQVAGVEVEKKELQDAKRELLIANALEATSKLATARPDADLRPLRTAVEKLLESPLNRRLHIKATAVLEQLEQRGVENRAAAPGHLRTGDACVVTL